MIYKLSNPYHTQRNNAVDPAYTCQATAAVMALRATGIPFDCPPGMQPEDHLASLLDSEEAHRKLAAEYPAMRNRPPREVHAVLSWAINDLLVGRHVSVFTTRATMQELLYRIAHHRAASLVTGRFTAAGHVVALVGFESTQDDLEYAPAPDRVDLGEVQALIVDDPWGCGRSGYASHDGNDVRYSLHEFNQLTREYDQAGRKWAHLFDTRGVF